MSGIVLKFPSDVSRRAHARKPRTSKNGTPEERATAVPVASEQQPARTCQPGHAWKPNHKGNNPLRAPFTAVSRAVTLVGKVIYRRHGFDPNELCEGVRSMWVTALREQGAPYGGRMRQGDRTSHGGPSTIGKVVRGARCNGRAVSSGIANLRRGGIPKRERDRSDF